MPLLCLAQLQEIDVDSIPVSQVSEETGIGITDTVSIYMEDQTQGDTGAAAPGDLMNRDTVVPYPVDLMTGDTVVSYPANHMREDTVVGDTGSILQDGTILDTSSVALSGGGDEDTPMLTLSLTDAVQELLLHNPTVLNARREWMAGRKKYIAAWGAFEPSLVNGYGYSASELDQSIYLEEKSNLNLGIEGKLFTGATYNFGFSLADFAHSRSTLDKPRAFTGVTVTQPLLKGAWFGAPMADITVSKIDYLIAFHTYRMKIMEMLYRLEAAYWDVSYNQEKYRFTTESVLIGEKLVKDSRERVRTGKMSQFDLLEAEAGLANAQANQADSRQELIDAVNRLKILLCSDTVDGEVLIHAATPLHEATQDTNTVDIVEDSLEAIMKAQPEYRIKRFELDRAKTILNYRKDQCLPELNLKGSFGYFGEAKTSPEALFNLRNKAMRTWSSEVQLNIPFFIEQANLLASEKLKKRIAEKNLKAAEYEIHSSLRLLSRRIKAFKVRIRNAGNAVALRKRLMDIEFVKLEAGKSNYRLIYDAEEKLSQAKQMELESIVRYKEAALQWFVLSGTLLLRRELETMDKERLILSDALLEPK